MNYDPELDFPIDINNIVDALDALNWNNIRGLSEENFAELHMISYDIRSWKLSLHRKDRIKIGPGKHSWENAPCIISH